jgi:hypothetical protein
MQSDSGKNLGSREPGKIIFGAKRPKIILLIVLVALATFSLFYGIKTIFFANTLSIEEILIVPLSNNEKKQLKKYNNNYHLEVAKSNGIRKPVSSEKDITEDSDNKKLYSVLEKLSSNRYFVIQRLTHSIPYIHTDVHDFLDELGKRFRQSCRNKGLRDYKFYITSVLRTEKSQKKLTKVNINATRNESAHLYGRTIDIAKTQFLDTRKREIVYSNNLGALLTRELLKMQEEGLCYVLFESKNHCLHITVR